MRRREFITALTGAAAWPGVTWAQQSPMPVIGLLSSVPFEFYSARVAAFREGLKELGLTESKKYTD